MYEMLFALSGLFIGGIIVWFFINYEFKTIEAHEMLEKTKASEDQEMTKEEMIDYLLSTGLYEINNKRHPEWNLYYEIRMMETDKTVPIRELVERFIEIDKYYNGESWNIMQILCNIDMIIPVEDRKENKENGGLKNE